MTTGELNKLKNVCDFAVNSRACKNPLLNWQACNSILSEWARDKEKPEEFRILCETVKQLCGWNKGGDQRKYQVLKDDAIVAVGTAVELEYDLAIDSKTIRRCAETKELCHNRYIINELKEVNNVPSSI